MPVWHELTKELVEKGELALVGITQEQHPDRCRLFAQWQGFDFPILWDPFNLTGLEVVPVLSAVDERGIVRLVKPDPRRFGEQFVGEFMEAEPWPGEPTRPPAAFRMHPREKLVSPQSGGIREALQHPALAQFEPDELKTFGVLASDPRKRTATHIVLAQPTAADLFRSGVAIRMRYDSPLARPGDFQLSAELWHAALAARPNQYIWRRRIQQWGPRLDKPYPFYDWVDEARAAITAAGGAAVALRVPLSGSEVADSSRAIPRLETDAAEPDPESKILRDGAELVKLETAVVRHTATAGTRIRMPSGASRIHVALVPAQDTGWALDADPAELWVHVPEGWAISRQRCVFPVPRGTEKRAKVARIAVDLEISTPPVPLVPPKGEDPPALAETLTGYALYSVCESDGTCVFRRQDFELELPRPPARPEGNGGGHDGDR